MPILAYVSLKNELSLTSGFITLSSSLIAIGNKNQAIHDSGSPYHVSPGYIKSLLYFCSIA